jgi:hypothetical protein|tara:strand:- start:563 stop:742 length:180 start_codon:yes stop_codon:yes gene_type:complete
MIIFGHPIHRKYTKTVYRIVIGVISIIVFIILVGCSKIDFDPTTTSLRYIFSQESKWKP